MTTDALFLGPHPDDAEIGCGGTILRLVASGHRVSIVDCTRGEAATKGTPETRAAEAAAASQLLGIAERENLGLPDSCVATDEPTVGAIIGAIRRLRPRLLFVPVERDAHPDHTAVAVAAGKAHFLGGLRNVHPDLGEPHRARVLIRYPGNDPVEPSFCVDISRYAERKRDVISCYGTQIGRTEAERAHYLRKLDPLGRAELRDQYFGAQTGCAAAEPFVIDGPFCLDELAPLLQEQSP